MVESSARIVNATISSTNVMPRSPRRVMPRGPRLRIIYPYCTATGTEPKVTGAACDWEFFKPISVTATEPFPRATDTKFSTATGPDPETPEPPAREIVIVASPASLRMSLTEFTAPPPRESRSPGAMSVRRITAGSHFTRRGEIEDASDAPFNSTFTVKGVFGATETLPGRKTTRAPAPGGVGGGVPGAAGTAGWVTGGCCGAVAGGAPAGAPGAGLAGSAAGADPSCSRGAYMSRSA